MSETKEQPSIKDFLIYLVKKGILPKQAVSQCRKRKQEAMEKGYSLTVKDILLEQGYIASDTEYQKLWEDMQEDFRIRSKIAERSESGDQNFSIPENLLIELISNEDFRREEHPDVPTDVILAVEARWKKKKESARQPLVVAALRMTQQIIVGDFLPRFSKLDLVLLVLFFLGILGTSIVGYRYCWPRYWQKYPIQQIQLQIPNDKQDVVEGKTIEVRLVEFQNTVQQR